MEDEKPYFEIVEGAVHKKDNLSDPPVAVWEPLVKEVVQILHRGDCLVLREKYYGYQTGKSNVYCLDEDFNKLWVAELPTPTDIYVSPVIDNGYILQCSSWECYSAKINPKTGNIVEKVFTK